MTALAIPGAFDDQLDELVKTHPADAGLIDALLWELSEDDEMLARLQNEVPAWHWQYKPPFEFKRYQQAWATGRRVFIVKIYDEEGALLPFRVFFGYDLKLDEYVALCISHRSVSYHPGRQPFRLLCERYDAERLPAIGR
ncbi:MAG: hypothetical protein GXC94_02685 [Comamonadaceae bacterium]|jgi:hypothetical protein|nr:hypothetical protein [Comamonadaceae bacterium]